MEMKLNINSELVLAGLLVRFFMLQNFWDTLYNVQWNPGNTITLGTDGRNCETFV